MGAAARSPHATSDAAPPGAGRGGPVTGVVRVRERAPPRPRPRHGDAVSGRSGSAMGNRPTRRPSCETAASSHPALAARGASRRGGAPKSSTVVEAVPPGGGHRSALVQQGRRRAARDRCRVELSMARHAREAETLQERHPLSALCHLHRQEHQHPVITQSTTLRVGEIAVLRGGDQRLDYGLGAARREPSWSDTRDHVERRPSPRTRSRRLRPGVRVSWWSRTVVRSHRTTW
jgi:hypothetical protein